MQHQILLTVNEKEFHRNRTTNGTNERRVKYWAEILLPRLPLNAPRKTPEKVEKFLICFVFTTPLC